MQGPLTGLVLDFDGVLVQSMALHAEAYRQTLAPFGVKVTNEEIFRMEGARSETIIHDLLKAANAAHDKDLVRRLSDEKQALYQRLGPPALYPGAEHLVTRVRQHFDALGLVTGTRRENLERLIPHLLPKFDAVLAQDSYKHDKPHPEPYKNSAKTLGVSPKECAALENAVRGVESAKAAKYAWIVGITTTMPAQALREAGADAVVRDHQGAATELVRWLMATRALA